MTKKILSEKETYELKLKQLELSKKLLDLKQNVPHKYGWKFYPWAKRVWESNNHEIFLCSANQVGKSSIAIRKNIELATNKELWKKFWPNVRQGGVPNLFWYFYPTFTAATTEFETKWVQDFLPKDHYKKSNDLGWVERYEKGEISEVQFNSGVKLQFKAYSQKIRDLQSASVYHVTADEEMPVDFLPEIKARLNATDGYFLMVFTATLGQLYWRDTMEPPHKDDEKHKDALKIQVSLYDSQKFDDGTDSHWTEAKIKRAIANCPTDSEIQRRVFGRFVRSEGLAYESFSPVENMTEGHPLPKDWQVFTGTDPGSGGMSGHPAAMVFIAVDPTYQKARVFRAWRGDKIATTSSDILDKYRELRGKLSPVAEKYDYSAKDFYMVASAQGEAFSPADKSRDSGRELLNTLFKHKMLQLQRGDPEIDKLAQELSSLSVTADKRKAKDDLIDALRYAVMAVPWNFSGIKLESQEVVEARENTRPGPKSDQEKRRDWFFNRNEKPADSVESELDYWNDLISPSDNDWY